MIDRVIQLEDISAVPAANGTGVVNIVCPPGYRYKDITLKLKNSANTTVTTSGFLGEIQMRLGGGIQRRVEAVKMDAKQALYGSGYASQAYGSSGTDYERHLKIYFAEPWLTRIRNLNVAPRPTLNLDPNTLGWKTGWAGVSKPLTISLAVKALGAGVSANISAEATINDDDDGTPNNIIRWNEDSANINGSLVALPNIANGLNVANDRIRAISIFDGTTTAGVISTIRLEVGNVVVKQDQALRALTSELIGNGMYPATANAIANAAHIIFDKNDALDDTLPLGFNSSLLKANYSTNPAGTVPFVMEVYGPPARS